MLRKFGLKPADAPLKLDHLQFAVDH